MTDAPRERALTCRVDADGSTVARLRRLADRTGAFVLCSDDAVTDVQVVGLADDDRHSIDHLRRSMRRWPAARTVVIADGTAWFDAAFEVGVDAWIDREADDATAVAAITGRFPAPRGGRRRRPRSTSLFGETRRS